MLDLNLRRRLWAEIDMDAARHNFLYVRSIIGEGVKLCCVVKANAYGHGALCLSRLYEKLGADVFAVSNIEEAMQLRKGGIKKDILILGYTPAECVRYLIEYKLTQTVYSYEYACELDKQLSALGEDVCLPIHIKLDSGMGRLGFLCKDGTVSSDVEKVLKIQSMKTVGIFTHFALSDCGESGDAYTRRQYESFMAAVNALKNKGTDIPCVHCANSASTLDFPEYDVNMVRAGIVLYGISPSRDIRRILDLKPVMSLRSVVSFVKTVERGGSISYGCTFTAEKKMRIATVPVGYADGYLRSNGNGRMYMLVRGKRARIVGRICMDQLMLDVTDIDGVCMGDTVTVIGRDGDEEISADMIAERNGTIPYEIMCGVGERVPRFYISDGEVLEIKDNIISDV